MGRILSEQSMDRIARELGVEGIVAREGWAGVPSRECGGVVHVAVRLAEEALARGRGGSFPAAGHRPDDGRGF